MKRLLLNKKAITPIITIIITITTAVEVTIAVATIAIIVVARNAAIKMMQRCLRITT